MMWSEPWAPRYPYDSEVLGAPPRWREQYKHHPWLFFPDRDVPLPVGWAVLEQWPLSRVGAVFWVQLLDYKWVTYEGWWWRQWRCWKIEHGLFEDNHEGRRFMPYGEDLWWRKEEIIEHDPAWGIPITSGMRTDTAALGVPKCRVARS